MLDKINGISDVSVSNPLHFDSYNNTHSPGLNVDVSGKGGSDSSQGGKLEEVMPILVKITEQLMEMLQSDSSAEDSMSGEGDGGDGVVPAAEESGSAGHSSSGEEESNNGAGMPKESGVAPEKSTAGSGDMSAAGSEGDSSMSGEFGEIMTMLVKLIEQLMKMMQGDSAEGSASGEGKEAGGTAAPTEGAMESEESMGAGSESPMSGESGEVMQPLAQLVEQLMKMLQGDSAQEGEGAGSDSAASPMEGSAASEPSSAEGGETPAAMGGEFGEIMQLLTQLVEQLMAMLQGDSTKDSASGEGTGSGSAEESGPSGYSPAEGGENTDAAATPMEGGMASEAPGSSESGEAPTAMGGELGEIMQLLTQLVEQLMATLQGDSTKDSASGEGTGSSGTEAPAEGEESTDAAATPMEGGMASDAPGSESGEAAMGGEFGEILQLLTELIEQLMAMMDGESGEGSASGEGAGSGSASAGESGGSSGHPSASGGENNSGAVTSAEGGVEPEASSGGSNHIPVPSEHMQSFDLGGKSVTIGSDGTAGAAEVGATADSIQNLYQNSDTFRSMIDSSSDEAFEVSVGKRDDNTSWGNSEGRVFMNINNVEPGNSDTFQSLLGHEFAHASIDIGHGGQMEQLESRVAAEA